MTSKEEDDTLPLTRFSSELMVDASVDEDFIPTSQPQSNGSCKSLKETVTNFEKCGEEGTSDGTSTPEPLLSATDPATLMLSTVDQSPDEDKFADFIPDTETKKRKFDYSKEKGRGSKKLREDSFVKCTEDIFDSESDSPWESEVSKVPKSAFSKCGIRNDDGVSKNERNLEECITEIIVNDSAETVDLDGSENLSLLRKKKKGRESEPNAGRMSVSCSLNSDVERCEETQIFENSSILLLDQSEVSFPKFGDSQSSVISAKLYLEETTEDKESEKDKDGVSESRCALMPATVKMPTESSTEESTTELLDTLRQKENLNSKFEQNRTKSNTENFESSFIETRKVEMKLSVSCKVTANIKTKQVLQKLILSVNELPSCKPKSKCIEHISDSASDKSKRQSTSSSGSVYSDKTGLPFALPKRVSAVSDQTDASDSSDECFSKRLRDGQKVFKRMPWTNEYLLPLKMDELIKVPIENQETLPKATNAPSPRKFKPWNRSELNHIEEILESSSFEHTSGSHTFVTDSKTTKLLKAGSGKCIRKDEGEDLKPVQMVKQIEEISQYAGCKDADNVYNSESRQNDRIQKVDLIESRDKQVGKIEDHEDFEQEKIRAKTSEENKGDRENKLVELREGLPVFARWTDKRYYSGVLCGTPKNYRWDIKFDDGTTKTMREEFLMPTKWLKVGELVFALVNDKYQSGQIAEVECGENETKYVVELDNGKNGVTVKVSDLCLSEVMANIVKERYKPLNATPRGKVSSDINFDNVIIGKRVREQRTPLRTTVATPAGNSETEKKSSNTKKREVKFSESQEASAQGNPQNKISSFRDSGNKSNGLISEQGHLVEDKVISGDSPSRNETEENCKRTRGKAKPRSLTYEPAKDRIEDKLKCRNWVTAEGTPIPGPSGIKLKTRTNPGSKKPETVPGFVQDASVCVARSSDESSINERFNWRNPKLAESKKFRSVKKSKGKRKG